MRRAVPVALCVLASLTAPATGATDAAPEAVAATTPAAHDAPRAPDPGRARALVTLLLHDCGACHGMKLTGGLGPPLTAAALRDKPPDGLVATVLGGRTGTAMPPWRPFVSVAEAEWLVARLQAGDLDVPR